MQKYLKYRKRYMVILLATVYFFGAARQVKAEESITVIKDGEYSIEVELEGGSGKAFVSSPTLLIAEQGKLTAELCWSSANYDYMIVDGVRYENQADGEMNSTFRIPILKMDTPMVIIADTTAMGTPHEIEYKLTFFADSVSTKDQLPREAAKKVIWIAMAIIVIGGILNYFVKKRYEA